MKSKNKPGTLLIVVDEKKSQIVETQEAESQVVEAQGAPLKTMGFLEYLYTKKRYLISVGLTGVVVGLLVILAFIWFQYQSYKDKSEKIDAKYQGQLVDMYKKTDELDKTKTTVITLQHQLLTLEKQHQKKIYYEKVSAFIRGFYTASGGKKTDKEYANICQAVQYSFDCAEVFFQKGEIKQFATSVREAGCRSLGQIKIESNFDPNCVAQNYAYDGSGRWVVARDNRKIYDKMSAWYLVENGTDNKLKWITLKNYYVTRGEGCFIMIGKDTSDKTVFKRWDEVTKYLMPTTKDYGLAQINDCNMTMCYSKLQKLGLWKPDSGKWALDPELNVYMRYIVEEDRIKVGFEKPGEGHWEPWFVESLMKIDGWQGIWAE